MEMMLQVGHNHGVTMQEQISQVQIDLCILNRGRLELTRAQTTLKPFLLHLKNQKLQSHLSQEA